MVRAASLTIALALLWVLLSGHITEPLLLGLGIASVMAVVFIAARMEVVDHEGHPVHLAWRAPVLYWPWLVKEIVLANLNVAKAILRWRMAIKPTVFHVKASQRSEVGRVTYANSITLTPGTVTIELEDDQLTIHALTPEAVAGLENGEMDRRITNVLERT